jgi:uncharacterized membrane protein
MSSPTPTFNNTAAPSSINFADLSTYQQKVNAKINSNELALEQMEQTEKRRQELTESQTQWNNAMNNIVMIAVISLALFIVILVVQIFVLRNILPPVFAIMASIAVLSIGFVIGARQYHDALIRWDMDFSKYDYVPPALGNIETPDPDGRGVSSDANAGTGNANSAFICFNSECCSEGTVWNPNINQCILP